MLIFVRKNGVEQVYRTIKDIEFVNGIIMKFVDYDEIGDKVKTKEIKTEYVTAIANGL